MAKDLKATLRIPTAEQYAYIEVQVEGTEEEILGHYHQLTKQVHGGEGLSDKEYNAWTDKYITGGGDGMDSVDLENYYKMNKEQQSHIQWMKRSLKRIEAKQK